jgi:hypothetical protein
LFGDIKRIPAETTFNEAKRQQDVDDDEEWAGRPSRLIIPSKSLGGEPLAPFPGSESDAEESDADEDTVTDAVVEHPHALNFAKKGSGVTTPNMARQKFGLIHPSEY